MFEVTIRRKSPQKGKGKSKWHYQSESAILLKISLNKSRGKQLLNLRKGIHFLFPHLLHQLYSQLFQKFESIGQEQYCPTFKVKLKGYRGEDLTPLIGKELTFPEYEVAFVFDKFKQPIGLSLVLELSDISVI